MGINHESQRRRRQDLLSWYDEHRRDLPWRRSQDAYAIWVSEIMLQQTRVETVLPYYERFLARFPTVESLAAADLDEVLGLWSGLGYYRRARLLHRAAGQIEAAGGQLPAEVRDLRKLPGIGAYTAAAISSIAFGRCEPAIDGNVERVMARFVGISEDPRRNPGRSLIRQEAIHLLDRDRPGDSNQALMELGATVCRPRAPRCARCPLESDCYAARAGEPEAFPPPRVKKPVTRVRRKVVVVQSEGRILLFRRSQASDVLAGMWELPWVECRDGNRGGERLRRRYGGRWQLGRVLGEVRHSITDRRFEIEIVEARLVAGESLAEGAEAEWFSPRDLESLAVSSLVRKSLSVAAASSATPAGGE